MRRIALVLLANIAISPAFAGIPYCSGTDVTGSKHQALQYVISTFAKINNCTIGNNCILNFDKVKYSIAWAKDCTNLKNKGSDTKGSTFICDEGQCAPYGFSDPSASY